MEAPTLIQIARGEAGLDLGKQSIASLLFAVLTQKFSGVLVCESDTGQRKLTLAGGVPLAISSSVPGEAGLDAKKLLELLFTLSSGPAKLRRTDPPPAGTPLADFLRSYLNSINNYNEALIQKQFPEINPGNFLRFHEAVAELYENFAMTPEERGIRTIASGAETVEQLFKQSLLTPLEKQQNLLKLMLLEIVSVEDKLSRQDRLLNEMMDAAQKQLKQEAEDFFKRHEAQSSYYVLLGIANDVGKTELTMHYQKLQKRLATEAIGPLYSAGNQSRPVKLWQIIDQAYNTLADEAKRKEYDDYLKSGGSGPFEKQSRSAVIEQLIEQGQALLTGGKTAEAYNHFRVAVNQNNKEPRLYAWAARTMLAAGGAQDKAKELANYALRIDGRCAEALRFLAEIDPKGSMQAEVDAIYSHLETSNYYDLLGVAVNAGKVEIQKAYHQKTRAFHPDRFFSHSNLELREKAKSVYKRVIEAYMVLKHADKRKEYDQQLIAAKQSSSGVRLKDAAQVVQRKERMEVVVKDPKAKKFFDLGMTALQTKNYSGASMNFKLALMSEPNNETIQKRLAEAEANVKKGF